MEAGSGGGARSLRGLLAALRQHFRRRPGAYDAASTPRVRLWGRTPVRLLGATRPRKRPVDRFSINLNCHCEERPRVGARGDGRGRDRDYSLPPAQIPACGFPAPGSCRRSGVIAGLDATDPQASGSCDAPCPVLSPGHASPLSFPPTEPPSLHALRRRSSRPCSGASSVLRGSSDSSPVPRQLRLLAFLPWPGIAAATAGQTRSPRFRRDPFVRDMVYDHGRASAPRRSGTAHVAFDVAYRLGLCIILAFAAQYIPHTIAVYASRQPSPTATQHSLPGARYGLPGPVFHRQDHASLLAHKQFRGS